MSAKRLGETSYKRTAFGIIPRSKLIRLEIEGIKRAWDFVLEKRKKGTITLTPRLIVSLHAVGFAWIFPKTGGRFRAIEVTVSDHIPPTSYLVPQYIEEYCRDIRERLKHLPGIEEENFLDALIEFLAWLHHRFLWIHPFVDYNGRIARLLINVVLLNLNLPPIELHVETKQGRRMYVIALQEADAGDMQKIERIVTSAIRESIEELRN